MQPAPLYWHIASSAGCSGHHLAPASAELLLRLRSQAGHLWGDRDQRPRWQWLGRATCVGSSGALCGLAGCGESVRMLGTVQGLKLLCAAEGG